MTGQVVTLITPSDREIAHRLIDAAPHRSTVTVAAPARSIDQNRKMWAMLADISRAMPEGRRHVKETWKALFMHACGHAVAFEPGLDGDGVFPVGFQSSRLNKGQMAHLITCIQEYGDRHGVQWTGEARATDG